MDVTTRWQERLHNLAAVLRRVALGPGLVRLTAVVLAAAAMIVAAVGTLLASPWAYPVIVVLAVAPAVRPATSWVTVVEVLVVAEWLLTSMLYHQPRGLAVVLLLAALLYAHHTTCALAAALPLAARLAPGVLVSWLGRTGAVIAATVVLAVLTKLALPATGTGRSLSVVPLLGLAAAVLAGVVIVWQLHRRR